MGRYGTSFFGPVELVFALTTERRTACCRANLPEPSSTLTILALDDPACSGANHLNGATSDRRGCTFRGVLHFLHRGLMDQ
jgi:hypothetical protein